MRDETKNMSRLTIQICKNLCHRGYVHRPINSYSYLVLNQFLNGFWEKYHLLFGCFNSKS